MEVTSPTSPTCPACVQHPANDKPPSGELELPTSIPTVGGAVVAAATNTFAPSRRLGVDPASGAKEEDDAFENPEEAADGQGPQGRDGARQVPCLWRHQACPRLVFPLCKRYADPESNDLASPLHHNVVDDRSDIQHMWKGKDKPSETTAAEKT